MKLLADENLDAGIVTWLRDQGHDVLWVVESLSGDDDEQICARAVADRRIVITRDRDFSRLVCGMRVHVPGLIFLRASAPTADERLRVFQRIWPIASRVADGRIVSATDRGVRARPLPL
ncbi:MAG: DUF5615 family PIN-like protein [Phycisphaerales bacterium]|nr:DUF5615 family PIN-like protein [Phycisphaerales bacterium]